MQRRLGRSKLSATGVVVKAIDLGTVLVRDWRLRGMDRGATSVEGSDTGLQRVRVPLSISLVRLREQTKRLSVKCLLFADRETGGPRWRCGLPA